jgi:hypothetical protein
VSGLYLDGTIRNYLKEWLRKQKWPNHFLGLFLKIQMKSTKKRCKSWLQYVCNFVKHIELHETVHFVFLLFVAYLPKLHVTNVHISDEWICISFLDIVYML